MSDKKIVKENSISVYSPNWLHRRVSDDIGGLEGKILTLVDALMPNGQQNKCTKDIIKGYFGDYRCWIHDHFFLQEEKGGFNPTTMDGNVISK